MMENKIYKTPSELEMLRPDEIAKYVQLANKRLKSKPPDQPDQYVKNGFHVQIRACDGAVLITMDYQDHKYYKNSRWVYLAFRHARSTSKLFDAAVDPADIKLGLLLKRPSTCVIPFLLWPKNTVPTESIADQARVRELVDKINGHTRGPAKQSESSFDPVCLIKSHIVSYRIGDGGDRILCSFKRPYVVDRPFTFSEFSLAWYFMSLDELRLVGPFDAEQLPLAFDAPSVAFH